MAQAVKLGAEAVGMDEIYDVDNAGGLMNVSIEFECWNKERALRMTRTIYYNLMKIFNIAERDNIPSYKAADRMAEERIEIIGKLKLPHMGQPHRFPGRIRNSGG